MEYNNSDKFILPALPLTKVKRICKLDAEVNSVSTQAVTLIAMATENFIKILSVEAYRRALFCDRRTLLSKDIEACIKENNLFSFLDGALDGWPEWVAKPRSSNVKDKDNGEITGDVQVEDAGKNNESEAMESTEVVESVPSEDVKESPVKSSYGKDKDNGEITGDVQVEDAGKNNESEAMESTEVVESVPSEDVKESPVRTNDV